MSILIINTFPTKTSHLKLTDILIWTASLINYKKMGYKLKLFCLKEDLWFLEHYNLYELYDEIDINLFKENKQLLQLDLDKFWASRKLEALNYQYNVICEDCVYSDTDLIMRSKFDLSKDALVWSPEDWDIDQNIYINWDLMSVPEGYIMPQYIKKNDDAYNAGILYFKNKRVFNMWYNEYYRFCIKNPCVLENIEDPFNNIFMCNAEQRILKAVLDHCNQDVDFIMSYKGKGWSEQGSHYFFFKRSWEHINDENFKPRDFVKGMLNLTIKECLDIIHSVSEGVYQYWVSQAWLKDIDKINIEKNVFPINEYI